jgi:hypothetical protein
LYDILRNSTILELKPLKLDSMIKKEIKIKAELKSVVKATERQLQFAPDLEGKIIIEGREYKVVIYLGLKSIMYLSI